MTKIESKRFFSDKKIIIICAIFCTLLWGSAFPCVKEGYKIFQIGAEDTYTKIVFAGYRFLLAGVLTILLSVGINRRVIFPKRNGLKVFLSLAIIQTFLQYIFYYIGLSHTTGVKGSILNATSTFFVVILAQFFLKNDKITVRKVIGCLIGFIGIIFVNVHSEGVDLGFHLNGEGFIIISAFFFACASIISKYLPADNDSASVTGWQLVAGGGLLIATGLAGGGHIQSVTPLGIGLLLYLAFISSAAFTLWLLLIRYNPAGEIAVYNFLTPIFGVILSGIILGEKVLTAKNLIALLCVSAGIVIVNKRVSKKDRKKYD